MYYLSQMKTGNWIRRFRVTALLVALLAAPVSASINLTTGSSDVCSMTCCVNKGHCCCSPQHARVKQLASSTCKYAEAVQSDEQCPEGCAVLSASISFLRIPVRVACIAPVEPASAKIHSYEPLKKHELLELASSSPRGPPAFRKVIG